MYLPTYLLTYLPTYVPTYLPTYLLTYVHTYVSTYLPYLFTYLVPFSIQRQQKSVVFFFPPLRFFKQFQTTTFQGESFSQRVYANLPSLCSCKIRRRKGHSPGRSYFVRN